MTSLESASNLSLKDKTLLAEVKGAIRQFLPASEVYLYGSTARGTHTPESDVDFLVVTGEPLTTGEEEAIWNAVFDIEMACGTPLSVQFCSKDEWQRQSSMPFYVEVRRDGIVL